MGLGQGQDDGGTDVVGVYYDGPWVYDGVGDGGHDCDGVQSGDVEGYDVYAICAIWWFLIETNHICKIFALFEYQILSRQSISLFLYKYPWHLKFLFQYIALGI